MAEETDTPRMIDQTRLTYVTLRFDRPVTNEELMQMQIEHRAIGAAQTIDQEASRPDWYHADNGFTSRHAMDAQHGPLVDLARDCLSGLCGRVIDLGCGNGVLVGKICQDTEKLVPCGVDLNHLAVEHARQLYPQLAGNFEQRDIFDPMVWSGAHRYALAILMAGRLKIAAAGQAAALLKCLQSRCDHLLLYVYPIWSGERLEAIVRQSGLRFENSIAGVAGIVNQG